MIFLTSGVNAIKGLTTGVMSTFAPFLRCVLTRVKQSSSLKLHFFVSTELGENTSEISTFV